MIFNMNTYILLLFCLFCACGCQSNNNNATVRTSSSSGLGLNLFGTSWGLGNFSDVSASSPADGKPISVKNKSGGLLGSSETEVSIGEQDKKNNMTIPNSNGTATTPVTSTKQGKNRIVSTKQPAASKEAENAIETSIPQVMK